MSPTLFSIYANYLALQIKASSLGVKVDDQTVGILLYVDDVVLLAEHEKYLQLMLNIVTEWCCKWRLVVNQDKTHTFYTKIIGESLTLDEHMTFKEVVSGPDQSAGRALGSVLNKVKQCGNLGFLHTILSFVCVPCLTMLLVFGVSMNIQVETLCIIELVDSFWESMNVLRFWSLVEIWEGNFHQTCQMLGLWNRLVTMSDQRLIEKIFYWDISHGHPRANELKSLFYLHDLSFIFLNRLLQEIRSNIVIKMVCRYMV